MVTRSVIPFGGRHIRESDKMNHEHKFNQIPRCSLAKCECGKTIYRENETLPRKVMVESESGAESAVDVKVLDMRSLCNQ